METPERDYSLWLPALVITGYLAVTSFALYTKLSERPTHENKRQEQESLYKNPSIELIGEPEPLETEQRPPLVIETDE